MIPPLRMSLTHNELLDRTIHKPESNPKSFVDDSFNLGIKSRVMLKWSLKEREIFEKQYQIHGKIFHLIAKELPKKSTSDCVQYYYLMKHEINSWKRKQYLKKSQHEMEKYNKHIQSISRLINSEMKKLRKYSITNERKRRFYNNN
jgi:hypothetical protein